MAPDIAFYEQPAYASNFVKSVHRFNLHVAAGSERANVTTVVIALISNVLVTLAKTIAAVLSRSPSMLAEAVHSWVDLGNEGFILAAFRTASRRPDETHPLGFGRESFVWSLFASLGMLVVGAVVTIWHGVNQLAEPDSRDDHLLLAACVLSASFLIEGASFVQTWRRMRKGAAHFGRGVTEQVFASSDSPLRAVFVEDFIALISIGLAAVGMTLRRVTGHAVYDAAGSIAIGILLATTAFILINNNRRYLEGKPLGKEARAEALKMLIGQPEIERVTFLYGEFIGPERVLLLAGVVLAGDRSQSELAYTLRKLERRIMKHDYIGLAMLSLATPEEDAAKA